MPRLQTWFRQQVSPTGQPLPRLVLLRNGDYFELTGRDCPVRRIAILYLVVKHPLRNRRDRDRAPICARYTANSRFRPACTF